MKYIYYLIPILFFLGCSSNSSSSSSSNSYKVNVFTTAPVVNAVVTDASNQVARYDPTTSQYIFNNTITYPILAKPNSTTYIDVDYDNILSSNDLKPSFETLKSFCNEVNLITSVYYSANYKDSNISVDSFKNDVNNRFNIDICKNSTINIENAKVAFGAYNYHIQDNNISLVEDISSEVAKVDDFFTQNLNTLNVDKIKYYSFYNALNWIDKHKVSRADTIHKPILDGVLRDKAVAINSYTNLDVRDMFVDLENVYTASAHDEFAKLDNLLSSRVFYGDGNLDSFGVDLFYQEYGNSKCLFLSNKKDGILPFDITSNNIAMKNKISKYIDNNNTEQNLTNVGINSTNGYVTISENKRFFAISTEDKGFYLINAKEIFNGCELTRDINSSKDILISGDYNTSISSYFRDDGSFLYVTNKADGITRYDLRTPTQANISSSKTNFSIQNNAEAYNIKLFPNSNELLVSTDKGLQIYDITNDENLTYVSSYLTEGAKKGYYPQIELVNDFIIYTDGDKGIKILKLDNSYQPKLCGAKYFSSSDTQELAKVTSVFYNNSYLYVGLDTFGIEKYRFDNLLFRHCK